MRFAVSRVMDMIEQRLTTDVTLAQAVVDLGEVVRFVQLDGGRPVNLVRIGMAVDALARYLVDAGALLYPVAGRELLSEGAFTSKERMVLSRWADDGLIEVVPAVGDRVVEVADLTGLPVITVAGCAQFVARYPWLREVPERVLRLYPRTGDAALVPGGEMLERAVPAVVVGKATVAVLQAVVPADPQPAAEQPPATPDPAGPDESSAESSSDTSSAEQPPSGKAPSDEQPPLDKAPPTPSSDEQPSSGKAPSDPSSAEQPPSGKAPSDTSSGGRPAAGNGTAGGGLPGAVATFRVGGAARISSTQVMRSRATRAEPSGVGEALLSHKWRCPEMECPAYSDWRQIGQPVPHMRGGVPACPKHGGALIDAGRRPASYAVAVVVDDMARRRFAVTEGSPVLVGRAPKEPGSIAVAEWLHSASARWISGVHLRLEVTSGALVVVDLSRNGTVIWRRADADDPGQPHRINRTAHVMGRWDSVQLYTGVELVIGERHRATAVWDGQLRSVLIDAPTVALRRPEFSA